MFRTLAIACVLTLSLVAMSEAADKHPIYDQSMTTLSGEKVDLEKYKGKTLLIVNTASQCGATPQYEPLQSLHEKFADQGLVVLGFPCNQFGKQEPGTSEDIASFCKANYGVTFDMFSKIDVNGAEAAPLFAYLTSDKTGLDDTGRVKWNFEKFLVSPEGKVVARFRTAVDPGSSDVVKAIESQLAAKQR